jgi:hypothetical protein
MNKRVFALGTMIVAGVSGWTSGAAEDHAVAILPALRFNADTVTNPFFEQIQRAPQFQKMSREALGSPIELRTYHTYRIGRGSAMATGLLGAATLGLIPQVSSGEHAIVYEVSVNGVVLTSYRYSKALTHAHSLWVQDTTHGLGDEGVKWATSTVDLFVKDAAADPKLAALSSEFDYYFALPK